MKGNVAYARRVAFQNASLLLVGNVPNADRSILAAGNKRLAVVRPKQIPNALCVALQSSQQLTSFRTPNADPVVGQCRGCDLPIGRYPYGID